MSQDSAYKNTVHLPSTGFPMKAGLVEREPSRLEKWEKDGLYERIQEARAGCPTFLLHDGPPFANGDVHMGTALNKILKDLVVKSKSMAGFRAPFIPGWDCHGLPIEFKVVRESAGLEVPEIRRRCEEFARKWIGIQKASFRRLGVFGDWAKPYLTMDSAYESDIIRFFATAIEKGLVYRSKRPVQWSYGAKTALAEAEVEYKEKTSPAIYVKFPAKTGPLAGQASFVIWTTTPWTLPANLGIMVRPDYVYTVGAFQDEDGRTENLVVLKDLVEDFAARTGFVLDSASAREFTGEALAGSLAAHPFLPRDSRVITSTFVTNDTGTGQVHTAPGHGKEDYIAGREAGLGLLSPVDDDGKFTDDSGMTGENGLPDLRGILVFDANGPIIKLLAEKGMLVGKQSYKHEYPHCWRSKTPVIFRSVEQFFLKIEDIRATALEQIDRVEWLPHWGRNRIYGTAESRPDWCISRQRSWGVPLPVFFDEAGELSLDAGVARKVADLVETHGTNLWFEKSSEELVALLGLPAGYTKGQDTLDVWIDSGCSSMAVTARHPALGQDGVADLYLEATDQHRGWFQSSLMCSVIHRGRAPYQSVMTHGFVTDTSGEKISKSGDKPINAEYYYNKYGADIVRLWVASVDWKDDVPFSDKLFEQNAEVYRRLRNTLRVLLGNVNGFDPAKDAVGYQEMSMLDQWILGRLNRLVAESTAAYAQFEFRKVFNLVNQFCSADLSAVYVDVTKDRMYCDAPDSTRRRATRTVMYRIADHLCRLLAPILAFTADEAWEFLGNGDSVHLALFPAADASLENPAVENHMEQWLRIRGLVQKALETERQAKTIGSNLEASVILRLPENDPALPLLVDHESVLEFLMVAQLEIITAPEETPGAVASATDMAKCERCWRHTDDIGTSEAHPTLCGRCAGAVG